MDLVKTQLIKLVNNLGPKQSINPTQACNKIKIYKRIIVSDTLEQLNHEGVLIKAFGKTYYQNPTRLKPLFHRGKF